MCLGAHGAVRLRVARALPAAPALPAPPPLLGPVCTPLPQVGPSFNKSIFQEKFKNWVLEILHPLTFWNVQLKIKIPLSTLPTHSLVSELLGRRAWLSVSIQGVVSGHGPRALPCANTRATGLEEVQLEQDSRGHCHTAL